MVVRGEAGGKVGEGEGRAKRGRYASQMLFAGQRVAMNSPVLNSPTLFISSFLNSAPGLSGNHPEAGIQRATQYHCRHPQVARRGLRGRVYFQRAAAPRRFCIYVNVRVCTMLKDTPARADHSQHRAGRGVDRLSRQDCAHLCYRLRNSVVRSPSSLHSIRSRYQSLILAGKRCATNPGTAGHPCAKIWFGQPCQTKKIRLTCV